MTTHAQGFIDFVNASPSPFHAVSEAERRLKDAGYQKLNENEVWKLEKGKTYYFTRNQSTMVAFAVGAKYEPGSGFIAVAAHSDSPNLHLKPNSKRSSDGYLQVGVQKYGGGLWFTWFDRDLKLAGRVIVHDKESGQYVSRLVDIDRPLMRIPSLCIHLKRDQNESFTFNQETQLMPVIATAIKDTLLKDERPASADSAAAGNHHPVLLHVLAKQLGCDPADIRDFELCLSDHQKATIGGVYDEFIFSPRLDNLMSSFQCMTSLVDTSSTGEQLANESNIRMAIMYDHEEVGSSSAQGASSHITLSTMERITRALTGSDEHIEVTLRNSFLISSDMAHAVHPHWPEKHETQHKPAMHKGTVIKHNANQRYATNATGAFVLRELARTNDIPIQDFVVRNDSACGSTIGPIVATRCGVRVVDVGGPQLSMHSIREMCGVDDVTHGIRLFSAFYDQFSKLDAKIKIDN